MLLNLTKKKGKKRKISKYKLQADPLKTEILAKLNAGACFIFFKVKKKIRLKILQADLHIVGLHLKFIKEKIIIKKNSPASLIIYSNRWKATVFKPGP